MSGGGGGQQPTFRGFLKASGQTKAWNNKDKKKVDQVHMSTQALPSFPSLGGAWV